MGLRNIKGQRKGDPGEDYKGLKTEMSVSTSKVRGLKGVWLDVGPERQR